MRPTVKYSRRQVTTALVKLLQAGIPVQHIADILAVYLIKTKQTRNIELYIRDIELAIEKAFDLTTVHVFSARKIGPTTKKRVKQLVAGFSGTKKFEIIEKIDPELIGGIVVKTANAEMDGSVRAKIRNLRSV